ncbi:MAG: peptide chain release factor N(5)-glutamine methyltransferase [Hyphomicrobiaceae bacterium]
MKTDTVTDIGRCETVRDALKTATAHLAAAGVPEAPVDSRHLVAHALGLQRAALLRAPETPLDAGARARLADVLVRRVAREPVSRIVGEREFHGLTLTLGAETLDPRPDTETVVAVALALASDIRARCGGPLKILDLGTGTGAIVLALLAALPDAAAVATDVSTSALEIARRNAERHGMADRVRFIRSCWLEDVAGRYHILVANPPYIPSEEISALAPEVAEWEPRVALDGGPDGLDAYRAILSDVARVLEPEGWAVFEVGHDQAVEVAALAVNHGLVPAPLEWPLLRDLGGNTRCVALATSGRDSKIALGIGAQGV